MTGAPTPEETQRIVDAKSVIFEGMEAALAGGVDHTAAGVLVDEQFGADVARKAKEQGILLAMPCEKSGQDEFDFEYGADFGAHIEAFDPTFTKVLVRFNPAGDGAVNARQAARLLELSDWLHAHDRKFLFELLVPAEPAQMEMAGGDAGRYDRELRPELMRVAVAELQERPGSSRTSGRSRASTPPRTAAPSPSSAAPEDATTWRAWCWGAARTTPRWMPGCARRAGAGLLRLRHRALHLVGALEGLRGRRGRAPGHRGEHRQELPALRGRVREGLRARSALSSPAGGPGAAGRGGPGG